MNADSAPEAGRGGGQGGSEADILLTFSTNTFRKFLSK